MHSNAEHADQEGSIRGTLAAVALILVATLIIHWQTVVGSCRFINYDATTQYYPLAEHYQRTPLRDLLWTPESGFGWPTYLSGYWTTFAPTTLLLFLLPCSAVWLCNLLCWVYLAAGGILMYACARRFRLSQGAALAAALVYVLAHWITLHRLHIVAISGIWLVPALVMLVPRTERGGIIPVALVVGLGVLITVPPVWLVALAVSTAFLILHFWRTGHLVRAFVRWTVGVFLGGCLGALQALPCGLLARASERYQDFSLTPSIRPLLRSVAGLFFAGWGHVPKLGFIHATHIGVAALFFVIVSVAAKKRDWRLWFLLAVLALSFLFALGTSTPVWWLALRVPLVGIFGDPGRWTLAFVFAAALVVGYGVDKLAQGGTSATFCRRAALIGFILYALSFLGSMAGYAGRDVLERTLRAKGRARIDRILGKPPHFHSRAFYEQELDSFIRSVLEAGAPWQPYFRAPCVAILLLYLMVRRRAAGKLTPQTCAWIAALVVGWELLVVESGFCRQENTAPHPSGTCAVAAQLPKAVPPCRVYTFYAIMPHEELKELLGPTTPGERSRMYVQYFHELLYPQTNIPRHVSQFGNPLPLIPRRENLVLEALGWPRTFRGGHLVGYIWDANLSPQQKATEFLKHLKLLQVFDVRFVVSAMPLEHELLKPMGKHALVVSDRVEAVTIHLYEVAGVLPRAFVVPQGKSAGTDGETLKTLLSADFDPLKTVLLSTADVQPCATPLTPEACTVSVADYRPRRVRIRVSADGDGYLVLSDAWSREWSASVDGEPVDILRANLACRAVRIGKGEHVIEFTHHPAMVSHALILGVGAAAALCVIGLVGFVRTRSREERD